MFGVDLIEFLSTIEIYLSYICLSSRILISEFMFRVSKIGCHIILDKTLG
jgi:hypothetical protein